jgi:hypothetical protein
MPCAHGLVKMATTKTVADVSVRIAQLGCDVGMSTIATWDLAIARNRLASTALAQGYSHIFYIDSDMSYSADLVATMLEADRDVIGLIYPHRQLSLERLVDAARSFSEAPHDAVIAKAQDYVVRLADKTVFENGMARVLGVGMGGTLMKTAALQTMIDKGCARVVPDQKAGRPVWGFFDLITRADGSQLSEDYSFCERWIGCGGDVWGFAARGVQHVGDFYYSGDLLSGRAHS